MGWQGGGGWLKPPLLLPFGQKDVAAEAAPTLQCAAQ